MKEISAQLMLHHKTVLDGGQFLGVEPARLSALQEDAVVFVTQQVAIPTKNHSTANPVIMRLHCVIS